MNNKSGIIRLVTASICILTIMSFFCYYVLFTENIQPTSAQNLYIDTSSLEVDEPLTESATSQISESLVSDVKSSQESVPTKASGTVLGKVVEKFISPYTANTSFSGIYLKNSTDLNIDLKGLLAAPIPYKIIKNSTPQVLIVHTHATESFLLEERDFYTDTDLSRTLDESYNMIRLGEIVANKLNAAGINTLHDKTKHDYPEYNGSYDRAADTINSYLKKYPDIKIVIDMHRDSISAGNNDKAKPVVEINGKKAAQVMLVMGSQSGNVKNFPNWQENLKLAIRLQQQIEIMYPSLARSLSFVSRLYNQNLTNGSMLIEMGTEANNINEVIYSAELVSEALIKVLNTLG